jgi:hypothetical protein
LNLSRIVIGFRHAREDLGSMIEAIVDEVVQTDVVVPWQTHGTRGSHAAAKEPGGNANGYESQSEQNWGQLKHLFNCWKSPAALQHAQLKALYCTNAAAKGVGFARGA